MLIYLFPVLLFCIVSGIISYILAIKNNQYILLPYMIGKCVFAIVSSVYGIISVFVYLAKNIR